MDESEFVGRALARRVRAVHDNSCGLSRLLSAAVKRLFMSGEFNENILVRMELSRIFIREMTDMQIIELSEVGGVRTFPIVIGLPEAFAIERRLKGIEIERPQTHDLLASIIEHLGGELRQVVINNLKGGTFYARLILERDGQEIEVDCRPSDAIALAVAEDVPIDVAEDVLERTAEDDLDELTEEDFSIDDDDEDEPDDELNWD